MTELSSLSIVHGEPAGASKHSIEKEDSKRNTHVDGTHVHVWAWEHGQSSLLTKEGLENIANHKYKSGHNTFLDNKLNPMWNSLTDLLPMSMAPNMVTTIGGIHSLLAYAVSWYFNPNFDSLQVPSWVLVLNGYCAIIYFTLDCMDGKQARRTGTSSPLGQLFDHGFDCLCNLAHLSSCSAYLAPGGTQWYFAMQVTLQFCFFMAQWEEYYTLSLPHAAGNIGVTEIMYGLGIISILNAFLDREAVYAQSLADALPTFVGSLLPEKAAHLQLRFTLLAVWTFFSFVLVAGSLFRTFSYLDNNKVRLIALSKLLSPALLVVGIFSFSHDTIQANTRYISIAAGLAFAIITNKVIVFSMAKMSIAAIQQEIFPFLGLVVWLKIDTKHSSEGARFLLQLLCIWYTYRLVVWARTAIREICERLDIYCFRIKSQQGKTKAE